ncbi:Oidioi.mRNA.OKI2018_I69.XSR.g15742.t3.cds [Oikopleura dioica]|uniref:Oidioi.mRNA.OKI2018_I69.XSR.g15742.t3.cds n=1 Tax=Oikopleura dioica TaxID=34765 RepID=A0ABN7SK74_OIKDI|nr:Oidioi.mRNA.OKI2018_I69.XSR.g15742.t3.cds [Oikopleura dioica]
MNLRQVLIFLLLQVAKGENEEVPTNPRDLQDAEVSCDALNKVVAVPRSSSDNEDLKTFFASTGKPGPILIGITKNNADSQWRDTQGVDITWFNWADGQPGSNDCATMSHNDGTWSTEQCSEENHFICRPALNGGTSTGECALFSGSCSIQSGFSIGISDSCRAERYPALPDDYTGVYVSSPKVLASDHATTIASLHENCQFDSEGLINIAFDECGTVETETDSSGTTVSIYGHHYQDVGGTIVSYISPPLKIDCFMAGVNLENSVDNDGTEETITFTLTAAEIVTALNIELQIGTVDDGGTFTAATDATEYAVGTEVHVKLAHDATDFGFALYDCSGGGVDLFTDYCPTDDAKSLFNVAFISHEEFKLNIFQPGDLDAVIFNCNLRIYAAEADEPADCVNRRSPEWKTEAEHKNAEVAVVGKIYSSPETSELKNDWTITTLVGLTLTQYIFYGSY